MVRAYKFRKGQSNPDPDGEIVNIDGNKIPIYLINEFHSLIQFVGYCKYLNSKSGPVYLRGQTKLFWSEEDKTDNKLILTPSFYRKPTNATRSIDTLIRWIRPTLEKLNKNDKEQPCFNDIMFPLVQHYGILTEWLDIVDNLWIALWFAMHEVKAVSVGVKDHITYSEKENDSFGYILLLSSDIDIASAKIVHRGIKEGNRTIINDLRMSCPSEFLRPHAQHAILIKGKDHEQDLGSLVVGIAKVPVDIGRTWIENTGLLSTHSLFPPAYYDNGYKRLLEFFEEKESRPTYTKYGSIQIYNS